MQSYVLKTKNKQNRRIGLEREKSNKVKLRVEIFRFSHTYYIHTKYWSEYSLADDEQNIRNTLLFAHIYFVLWQEKW